MRGEKMFPPLQTRHELQAVGQMSRPHSRLSRQHSAGDVTSLQALIAKAIAAATEVAEDLAEGGAKYAQHVTTIGDQVGGAYIILQQ